MHLITKQGASPVVTIFGSEHYHSSNSFMLWVYNYATEQEARKVYKTFATVEKHINKLLYDEI